MPLRLRFDERRSSGKCRAHYYQEPDKQKALENLCAERNTAQDAPVYFYQEGAGIRSG